MPFWSLEVSQIGGNGDGRREVPLALFRRAPGSFRIRQIGPDPARHALRRIDAVAWLLDD
jgi:hypothetical protein